MPCRVVHRLHPTDRHNKPLAFMTQPSTLHRHGHTTNNQICSHFPSCCCCRCDLWLACVISLSTWQWQWQRQHRVSHYRRLLSPQPHIPFPISRPVLWWGHCNGNDDAKCRRRQTLFDCRKCKLSKPLTVSRMLPQTHILCNPYECLFLRSVEEEVIEGLSLSLGSSPPIFPLLPLSHLSAGEFSCEILTHCTYLSRFLSWECAVCSSLFLISNYVSCELTRLPACQPAYQCDLCRLPGPHSSPPSACVGKSH